MSWIEFGIPSKCSKNRISCGKFPQGIRGRDSYCGFHKPSNKWIGIRKGCQSQLKSVEPWNGNSNGEISFEKWKKKLLRNDYTWEHERCSKPFIEAIAMERWGLTEIKFRLNRLTSTIPRILLEHFLWWRAFLATSSQHSAFEFLVSCQFITAVYIIDSNLNGKNLMEFLQLQLRCFCFLTTLTWLPKDNFERLRIQRTKTLKKCGSSFLSHKMLFSTPR